MRRSSFVALCLGLLGCLMMPQAAEAQAWTDNECTVSLTWPYSREPGDCLTDAERRGGLTGTYQDPDGVFMRSPVAIRALRNLEGCEASGGPEPRVAVISDGVIVRDSPEQRITITGFNFRCNSQAYFNAIPVPTVVVSPTQLEVLIPLELAERDGNYPIVVRNRAPVALANLGPRNIPNELIDEGTPAAVLPPGGRTITNERGCNTGLLWPYFRDPGDCLTDAEREAGMVGVYGASTMAGEAEPDPSTISPLPTSSGASWWNPFAGESDFGGGGLLDDNLLPPDQRGQ